MLLEKINNPHDLRELSLPELHELAEEMRERILKQSPRLGLPLIQSGHVELTLALHYVFDTPEAQIVWDVGHQCYPTRC
jgi:1-deoxy-D-xylulose-5-phosphate synthase